MTWFPTGLKGSPLGNIVSGADGNLWYPAPEGVGRIATTGTITLFPVATQRASGVRVAIDVIGADAAGVWIREEEDAGETEKISPRTGHVSFDGRVTWTGVSTDHFNVVASPGALWLYNDDGVVAVNLGTGARQSVHRWQGKDADVPGCDERTPTAPAGDGSVWLLACTTALHLRADGSAVAVALPNCADGWSGAPLPSDGLELVCAERALTASGATIVADERWTDPFGSVSTFGPEAMAFTPDGALWMTSFAGSLLRRPPSAGDALLSPLSPALAYSPVLGRFTGVAVDSRGTWWLGSPHGLVSRTADGVTHLVRITKGAANLSAGAGRVWFLSGQRAVGIEQNGRSRIVLRTGRRSTLAKIAATPDGGAWLTDPGRNRIGRITTTGRVNWYARGLARADHLIGITATPDGGAWFVAQSGWVGT